MSAKKTKNMVRVAFFAAVISVAAQIALPFPTGVPLTIQSFAVALAGYVLGVKHGLAAVAVYLAVGSVGMPVFSGMMGGISRLLGVSGGFLWGFLPYCALCALGRDRSRGISLALSAAGLTVCHVMGVLQYAFLSKSSFVSSFVIISLPYILKDILLLYLARSIAKSVRRTAV